MRRKSFVAELRRLRVQVLPTPAERRHAAVGPGDLWREKREFQIEFLRRMGLRPRHRLLDVGCGTLRGGLPLIGYLDSGNYCGIEARGDVLAEGRAELAESGLEFKEPLLLVGADFDAISIVATFDFVWAFSVLIHMEDDVMRGCLRFVAKHLAPGGSFLANVNAGTHGTGRWKEFPVVWRPVEFYAAEAAAVGLSVEDLGPLTALGECDEVKGASTQHMLRMRAR